MFENLNLRYLILNALIFLGATAIPLYLVALSNKHVFPSTITMANGFLLMSLAAALACMVVIAHKGADARTIAGAIFGEIALGLVLWWNIGGHWQLSREYDAAQAGVQEGIEEDKRAADREKGRVENERVLSDLRQKELDALAKLEKQQAINTDASVRLAKATGSRPMVRPRTPGASLPAPTPTPVSTARTARPAGTPRPIPPTPAEVQQAWMPTLTTRAYLEAGAAILILISLGVLWHIDFDRDGVSDRKQRLPRQVLQEIYPEDYEKLYGKEPEALQEGATASLPAAPAQAAFTVPRIPHGVSSEQPPARGAENNPKTTPDPGLRKPRRVSPPVEAAKSPEAGTPDFNAPKKREGNDWILFGLRFPDIPGVRYESKKKTLKRSESIEFWGKQSHRGSMISSIGKKEIIRLAALSDGERAVQVAAAIANKMAQKGIGVTGVD